MHTWLGQKLFNRPRKLQLKFGYRARKIDTDTQHLVSLNLARAERALSHSALRAVAATDVRIRHVEVRDPFFSGYRVDHVSQVGASRCVSIGAVSNARSSTEIRGDADRAAEVSSRPSVKTPE